MKPALAAVVAMVLTTTPLAAVAATRSVTETAIYTLGDNDTLSAGWRSCIAKAKAAVLDRAGSLFESDPVARQSEADGEMTDEARSDMAAVIGTELLSQNIETTDGRLTVSCSVRVSFDPDESRDKLRRLAGDNDLRRKLDTQQIQIDALAKQIQATAQNAVAAITKYASPLEQRPVERVPSTVPPRAPSPIGWNPGSVLRLSPAELAGSHVNLALFAQLAIAISGLLLMFRLARWALRLFLVGLLFAGFAGLLH